MDTNMKSILSILFFCLLTSIVHGQEELEAEMSTEGQTSTWWEEEITTDMNIEETTSSMDEFSEGTDTSQQETNVSENEIDITSTSTYSFDNDKNTPDDTPENEQTDETLTSTSIPETTIIPSDPPTTMSPESATTESTSEPQTTESTIETQTTESTSELQTTESTIQIQTTESTTEPQATTTTPVPQTKDVACTTSTPETTTPCAPCVMTPEAMCSQLGGRFEFPSFHKPCKYTCSIKNKIVLSGHNMNGEICFRRERMGKCGLAGCVFVPTSRRPRGKRW